MDWYRKMMRGRNGADHLVVLLVILFWPFAIAARLTTIYYLFIPAYLCMLTACFRFLSKNLYRRKMENMRLLQLWRMITGKEAPVFKNASANAAHRYFTCPGCNQKLRMPAGKGKVTIRCPKCKFTFQGKT